MSTATLPSWIDRLREHAKVTPATRLPRIRGAGVLAGDLVRLYQALGEAVVDTEYYGWRLLRAEQVVPANEVLVGEFPTGDRSDAWYCLLSFDASWFVSVDTTPDRAGRCYDSTFGGHGIPGSMPVVALTVAELIERLLDAPGKRPYWLAEDFSGYGDAHGEADARTP